MVSSLKSVVSRSPGNRPESAGCSSPQSVEGAGVAGVKQTTRLLLPRPWRIGPHPERSLQSTCAVAGEARKNTAASTSSASIRYTRGSDRGAEGRAFGMKLLLPLWVKQKPRGGWICDPEDRLSRHLRPEAIGLDRTLSMSLGSILTNRKGDREQRAWTA